MVLLTERKPHTNDYSENTNLDKFHGHQASDEGSGGSNGRDDLSSNQLTLEKEKNIQIYVPFI